MYKTLNRIFIMDIKQHINLHTHTPFEELPKWFQEAKTTNAVVKYLNGVFLWYKGIWNDGKWYGNKWLGGDWVDGIWVQGTWITGEFHGGTWCGGTWEFGVFRDGVWFGGTWEDGLWLGGTWTGGTWVKGRYPFSHEGPTPHSPNSPIVLKYMRRT